MAFPRVGVLNQVFDEVGADFDIVTHKHIVYRLEGKDYEIPPVEGLDWLFSQVTSDKQEVAEVMGALNRAINWYEPGGSVSFRDWLLQYTQNEKILGIFQSLIVMGRLVNIWELSAQAVIRALGAMSKLTGS